MMFDAIQIARGWLAVAQASSNDRTWPTLYRSVLIEQHPHGVRLAATDGYIALHTYVAELHHEDDEDPEIDEAPMATAIAIDYHGRAKGFLAHVLKLATADDDAEQIDVRLRLNVLANVDADQGALEGLEARSVLLEQPDVERVVLPSFEGQFPPNWRTVVTDLVPVSTGSIALYPDRLTQLAKAGKLHPHSFIGWTFTGPDKVAHVELVNSDPYVSGAVMPVRWDLWRNEPATPPAGDEPDGGGGPADDDPDGGDDDTRSVVIAGNNFTPSRRRALDVARNAFPDPVRIGIGMWADDGPPTISPAPAHWLRDRGLVVQVDDHHVELTPTGSDAFDVLHGEAGGDEAA